MFRSGGDYPSLPMIGLGYESAAAAADDDTLFARQADIRDD